MPFCANCGTSVADNDRFCKQCGSPRNLPVVDQQAPQYTCQPSQVAPVAGQSRTVSVLPQAKMVTATGVSDIYTIVFTPNQAIMARLTGNILNDAAKKSQAQGKAEGKGWMGRAGDQRRAVGSVHLRYLEMTSEQILAETTGNFAIDHTSVASISVRVGYELSNQDVPGDPYTEIGFYSNKGTFKYRLRMPAKDVAEILINFYPGRITK
jgi:hypothetical protein